ncbi:hypothetical protein ACFW2D_37505 [Streptomyces sp. NPDC058914]|uniref:hypothetical protein n=1 Tax=Streptomyces TaxID=1883 RepID=UPI003675209C
MDDPDALVRAAPCEALGATGCPASPAARAETAPAAPARQVRGGADAALSAADPGAAVPALAETVADADADADADVRS